MDGKEIDIVSETSDWQELYEVNISCFKIKLKNATGHKMYQIAWYLKEKHIKLKDIESAIAFLNYLESIDIEYDLTYNWCKAKKNVLIANAVVFTQWYLPTKLHYIRNRVICFVAQFI